MTCASCVNSIETHLRDQPWVQSVVVNLLLEEAVIAFTPGDNRGPRELIQMIDDIGYTASLKKTGKSKADEVLADKVCSCQH